MMRSLTCQHKFPLHPFSVPFPSPSPFLVCLSSRPPFLLQQRHSLRTPVLLQTIRLLCQLTSNSLARRIEERQLQLDSECLAPHRVCTATRIHYCVSCTSAVSWLTSASSSSVAASVAAYSGNDMRKLTSQLLRPHVAYASNRMTRRRRCGYAALVSLIETLQKVEVKKRKREKEKRTDGVGVSA